MGDAVADGASPAPPTTEAAAAPMLEPPAEDEQTRRRREIEEKVAALKLARQKEEEQKTVYYGQHPAITCDGCRMVPIEGYRYRCKSCPNHDVCETCYDRWAGGKGTMENGLKKQVLSPNAADHSFALYKDKMFKPLVKGTGQAAKAAPKMKPNDPCTCKSGKKYKKCCGAA